jgi:hypothetical protein
MLLVAKVYNHKLVNLLTLLMRVINSPKTAYNLTIKINALRI